MKQTSAAENPFYVLELPTLASPRDVERQKQRLLGMLELGLESACFHKTPLGNHPRSAESVRRAAAALEEPRDRIIWELWAALPATEDEQEALSDNLRTALALHYQTLRRSALTAHDFDELGELWDEVLFSDELLDALDERADEVGLDDIDDSLDTFSSQVTRDLLALLERVPPFNLDLLESETSNEAAALFGEEAAMRLEAGAERFCSKVESEGQMRLAWQALRRQYEDITKFRGDYLRNLAFEGVRSHVEDFACEVHAEECYFVSEILFIWLWKEASAVDDQDTVDRQAENVRIARSAQESQVEPVTWTLERRDMNAVGNDNEYSEEERLASEMYDEASCDESDDDEVAPSYERREPILGRGGWLSAVVMVLIFLAARNGACSSQGSQRHDFDIEIDIDMEEILRESQERIERDMEQAIEQTWVEPEVEFERYRFESLDFLNTPDPSKELRKAQKLNVSSKVPTE